VLKEGIWFFDKRSYLHETSFHDGNFCETKKGYCKALQEADAFDDALTVKVEYVVFG